ncbi:hypothetical protein NBRC116493_15870 [Aurantivibrio infirmus]
MATQADLDWEQYQLGQQGTVTGSCYNEMGLNDRPQSNPSWSSSSTRKTSKPKAATKPKAKAAPKSAKAKEEEYEMFFGFITFAIVGLYLYQPADENGVAALICAGIAGVVVGKLYKVILAGAILVGIIYAMGYAA